MSALPADRRGCDHRYRRLRLSQRLRKAQTHHSGQRDQYGHEKALRDWFHRISEPKKLVIVDAPVHLFDGKLTELKNAIVQEFPALMESVPASQGLPQRP